MLTDKNLLGQGVCGPTNAPSLTGQLANFRVWKTQRTAQQIRDAMFKKLNGDEPGLVGLWNFDDPANPGRDSSPGTHHGKRIGQATVTNVALPGLVVFVMITDASGQPDRRIPANATGEYAFTMAPAARCELFVTDGELSAYRLGFQLGGDWQSAASRIDNPQGVTRSTARGSSTALPNTIRRDRRLAVCATGES